MLSEQPTEKWRSKDHKGKWHVISPLDITQAITQHWHSKRQEDAILMNYEDNFFYFAPYLNYKHLMLCFWCKFTTSGMCSSMYLCLAQFVQTQQNLDFQLQKVLLWNGGHFYTLRSNIFNNGKDESEAKMRME